MTATMTGGLTAAEFDAELADAFEDYAVCVVNELLNANSAALTVGVDVCRPAVVALESDVRAVWEWVEGNADSNPLARTCGALLAVVCEHLFFAKVVTASEWARWCQLATRYVGTLREPVLEFSCSAALALALLAAGEPNQAAESGRRMTALAATLAAPWAEIEATTLLARCHLASGELHEADGLARQVLKRVGGAGWEQYRGTVESLAGLVAEQLGQKHQAFAHFDRAITAFDRAGDSYQVALVRRQTSELSLSLGRRREDVPNCEQWLASARRVNDRAAVLRALKRLGNLLVMRGEFAAARRHLEEGLTLARVLEDANAEEGLLGTLSVVYAATDEAEKGRRIAAELVDRAERTGRWQTLITHRNALTITWCETRGVDWAVEYAAQTVELAERSDRDADRGSSLFTLGGMLVEAKRANEVLDCFRRLRTLPNSLPTHLEGGIEKYLAVAHLLLGDEERAMRHYHLCAAHADREQEDFEPASLDYMFAVHLHDQHADTRMEDAIGYYLKAFERSRKGRFVVLERAAAEGLSRAYRGVGRNEEADRYVVHLRELGVDTSASASRG